MDECVNKEEPDSTTNPFEEVPAVATVTAKLELISASSPRESCAFWSALNTIWEAPAG